MSKNGKLDRFKGKVEEAAGILLGDDLLKQKGKLDQKVGEGKDAEAQRDEKIKAYVENATDPMKLP